MRLCSVVLLLGLLTSYVAVGACASPADSTDAGSTTVTPVDTGEALVNPGMGWCLYFYSNVPKNYGSRLEPSDTVDDFPGLSTVYLRVPWSFLEPEEGQYNWALFDTPAQRWIAKGKRIAIRVTCSENWIERATPKWVEDAGAKMVRYSFGEGPSANGKLVDPVFDDPIFLEKFRNFLTVMALRYDGNSHIDFIDIGSFGLWGEAHTHMSSQVPAEKIDAIARKHIDVHTDVFKKTQLCLVDDVIGHDVRGTSFPLMDYALSQNVTFRDDSIMVQPQPNAWYHAGLAQQFWPRLPVILEHEHYGSSKARNAWGDGSLLLKAVEDHHASYLSIHWWPHEHLEANRAVIAKINKRLGYRLQLRRLTWPQIVTMGASFTVTSEWANAGVAPCYGGGHMAVTLKDGRGGIVSVLSDETFNMRDLPVSTHTEEPESITHDSKLTVGKIAPVTKSGTYQVFVSVGRRDGTPEIALPLPNSDGAKRYRVGEMKLQGAFK